MVVITGFKAVGEDERGITKEFSITKGQSDFIFITRKKDTISGNNYHLGIASSINPKRFVLLAGTMELSYRKVGSHEKISQVIEAPCIISIKPQVIHAVRAVTDVMLLECNSIADIQNDNIKEMV